MSGRREEVDLCVGLGARLASKDCASVGLRLVITSQQLSRGPQSIGILLHSAFDNDHHGLRKCAKNHNREHQRSLTERGY